MIHTLQNPWEVLIETCARGVLAVLAVTVVQQHLSTGVWSVAIAVVLLAWSTTPLVTASKQKDSMIGDTDA